MSILIVSNYRSGTTYYCEYLAKKYNLKNLDELMHSDLDHLTIRQNTHLFNTENCVAKIFPGQVLSTGYHKKLNPEKMIVIRRKDFLSQLHSYIIAGVLGATEETLWHGDIIKEKILTITAGEYAIWTSELAKTNSQIEDVVQSFSCPCDVVYYEDFATPEKKYKRNVKLIVTN